MAGDTGVPAGPGSLRPGPALWALVFAGPALRTSLLGALLVAEEALGQAFGLSAEALAILVESVIFGSLLAIFLLPPLIGLLGVRRLSLVSTIATAAVMGAVILAAQMLPAGALPGGALTTGGLFLVATLLGFLVAVLSPITQTLLNRATQDHVNTRHELQSVWSAGQPAGFIVASVIGGVLIEVAGWWTAMIVPLAFAVVAALSLLGTPASRTSDTTDRGIRPGIGEILTVVVALGAYKVWATWGTLQSWFEPGVLAALAATLVVSTLAVRQLRRSPNPAVSIAPFSAAGFLAAALILLVYQFPTTAEFEVLLLTELGHMSAVAIGDRTALGNIGQLVGTALAAVLLYRREAGIAFVGGFVLTIVGLAGYVLYPWWNGFAFATATRVIAGVGGGLLTPVLFVVALNRMPPAMQIAAGTWLVLATIGGTEIGLALFDVVLEVATAATDSKVWGYVVVEAAQLAVGVATAALTAWFVHDGRMPLAVGGAPASPAAAPAMAQMPGQAPAQVPRK